MAMPVLGQNFSKLAVYKGAMRLDEGFVVLANPFATRMRL